MATGGMKTRDLEVELEDYIKLPFKVSRFLASQERDDHVFEEFYREEDGSLITKFRPGSSAEGPPGHCHGGFQATLLDENMGGCAWWNMYVVLAANLNIRYRKPAPLDTTYYAVARLGRVEQRRVYCDGRLMDRDGTVYAQGTGVFVRLSWDKFPRTEGDDYEHFREMVELRESGVSFEESLNVLKARNQSLTPPT